MDFSLKNNNSKKTIKSPKSTLIAQGTIEPLKAASIAQGTIEYLVVIAVIIVISLFITTLLITQTDNTEKIGVDSDKASGIIGKGGISVIDSVTSANGESVVSLKNNSGETFTVTKITPLDSQGTLGTSNEYNQDIFPGYEFQFIITDINSICPCVDGKTTTCNIKVTFVDSTGFEKTETLKITNTCILKIDYYYLKYTPTTGGTIIGDLNQNILPGKSGSPVTAQPEEGYTFLQWSDGTTTNPRTDTSVNSNLEIIAEFELDLECTLDEDCENESLMCENNICVTKENGTREYPWIIIDCEDLQNMNLHLDGNYVLGDDIDCSGFYFDPIGGAAEYGYNLFTGNFDGQYHSISNLTINKPLDSYVGLFARLANTGEIKNTGLNSIVVSGKDYVGSFSGVSSGTITNSYSKGNVSGTNFIGGIVGAGGGTITNSYSKVNVSGTNYVGGIVGNFGGTMTKSYSTGIISGGSAGGLVGTMDYITPIITNSYYNYETSGQSDTGKGEPRTTDDMNYEYAADTFVDWDFINIWTADIDYSINEGYPYLKWQTE